MSAPVVEVEDLSVRFGDHEALRGLHFSVEEGSFVTVVGPNGSGKTTLLRTLLGLVRPARGRACVCGHEPGTVLPDWIGYVPQVKTLERTFPALALELVLTGLRRGWPGRPGEAERDRAFAALARAGAGHLGARSLGELSGGELQRVYLARSLIRNPRLLMLDEPATGIDAAGATGLMDHLIAYGKSHAATILMVTHDWNVAYHHATHALLLDREQVAYGPPAEALDEENMRVAFGHVGHAHAMLYGGGHA